MTQQTCKQRKLGLNPILVLFSFFAILLGSSLTLSAGEAPYIRHSIRALGMGHAFVAVSNDEYVLFYNPAGLEQIQNEIYQVANPSIMKNQTADDILGIPSATRAAALPGFLGKKLVVEEDSDVMSTLNHGWGYSLFTNGRMEATVNAASVDLLAYQQIGAVGGMSWSFMDHTLDVGVAAQYVIRSGTAQNLSFIAFADPNLITTIMNQFGTTGKTSFTAGLLYHMEDSFLYPITIGLTMRNLGGMHFQNAGGVSSTMDIGISTEVDFFGADVLFAADYEDLQGSQTSFDLQRNLRFGMEIGLFRTEPKKHIMTWRFGMHGPYASSGFSVRVPYGFQLDYAVWTESIGNTATDTPDRRQALQLSFNY